MNNLPIKIVFMGTPDFAVPSLQLLHFSEQVEVIAVVTQPDKPAGRGGLIQESPVKQFAQKHNIKVLQPYKIRSEPEVLNYLKECRAEFFVTVAFGQILSKEILDIPPKGTINLHASLLPKYRGPNPIQWSIINGDTVTGLTTMLTDEGVDTGDILVKHLMPILIDYNAIQLSKIMASNGSRVLLDSIIGINENSITPEKQDNRNATKAPKLHKNYGNINWTNNTLSIYNLIRGTKPWPGAYTTFKNTKIKIHSSFIPYITESNQDHKPGEITSITKEYFQICTGDSYIDIIDLQPPNKPIIKAVDWARGARVQPGDMFEYISD